MPKQEILSLESYQHTVHQGKNRRILGYFWIKNVNSNDLVVIDTSGVEFFKLQKANLKLISVKHYQMTIGHYWYSGRDSILLVALSPPKLGQFCSFFLNHHGKSVPSVKFSLDLAPCVTDKWTVSGKGVSSLSVFEENLNENSPHEVALVNLYGLSYLVHMQSLSGNLKIYRFKHDEISLMKEFSLTAGQYGVRCIDNLVLMQNYALQETYVLDVKGTGQGKKPFCIFWNNMKNTLPTLSLKLRIFIEKPKVLVNANFLYDGKVIKDLASFTCSKDVQDSVIECKMSLNPSLVYVDHDICVDIKEGRCYKLKFSPLSTAEQLSNKSDSLLFLFRRKGLQVQAFEYFRLCLQNGMSLAQVSSFFDAINNNYKNAIIDKKPQSAPRLSFAKASDMAIRRRSLTLEPELKLESGSVVITQDDMHMLVFNKLVEDQNIDLNYLALVMQEYFRSLVSFELEPKDDTQLLLAELLVACHKSHILMDMLRYYVFTDSFRLVKYLISLIPADEAYLEFSVDMLFRMAAKERIIDVILEKSFVFEAVQLLAKVQHPQFDLMKLLNKCQELGNERLTLIVSQFIKAKSL